MTLLQCNEKKKSFVTVTTGPLKAVLEAVLEAVHVGEKKVEKPLPSRKQSYDAEMAKESTMIQTVKVQKEEEDKLVFLNAETRKKENCEFGVRKKLSAANFVGGEACSEA